MNTPEEDLVIYKEQIATSRQIIEQNFCSIENEKRWVTLIAEMQSGKTGTYLFTIFEMFRLGKIINAVIMCGSSDLELKNQVQFDLNTFVDKYLLHLGETSGLSNAERVTLVRRIKANTQIIWGTELKKATKGLNRKTSSRSSKKQISISVEGTLFVWEESHYAQSDGNQMDGYLSSLGISPSGVGLSKTNTYFLSVSATPISECSDIVHLEQTKGVVLLETNESYYGVAEMMKTGKIVGYNIRNFKRTLEGAIVEGTPSDGTFKYGIIRVSGAKSNDGEKPVKGAKKTVKMNKSETNFMREIYEVAIKLGWKVKHCDSSCMSSIKISELAKAPEDANTIVVIKGKCRMGEVVKKTHIVFGMETSANANTDTMLQSILGRLCGHTTIRYAKIYIPDKFTENGELSRYLDFIDKLRTSRTIECLPQKAKNVTSELGRQANIERVNIIPVKVNGVDFVGRDASGNNDRNNTTSVKEDVFNMFYENITQIENQNSQEIFEKICHKVDLVSKNKERVTDNYSPNKVVVRTIKRKGTYNRIVKILHKSITTQTPLSTASSISAPNGITIWIFGEDYPEYGFNKNDVYLDTPISDSSDNTNKSRIRVPKTTKREIFRHTLPTKEDIFVNGAMLLGLDPDTLCDCDMMNQALKTLVKHSLNFTESKTDGLVYHRRINSVVNQTSEHAGIWITTEICEALEVGGSIYKELLDEFGVSLNLVKDSNPETTIDILELVKLNEISW